MSMNYDVHTACLRYVVPFKFEGAFEDASRMVEDQKEIKKNREKALGKKKG